MKARTEFKGLSLKKENVASIGNTPKNGNNKDNKSVFLFDCLLSLFVANC